MIDDETAARRLARATLEDLVLYNGARALEGSPALEEARALFGTRIAPALVFVFDEELRQRRGAGDALTPRSVGETPAGAAPMMAVLVGAVFAMLLIAGAVFFVLR